MSSLPRVSDVPSWLRATVQQADRRDLPRWKAILVSALRIGYGVARDLSQDQLTLRAMSLVYTTLLSLVPLLAISFSVLKGFGVHNQIEPFLLNLLAPLGEKADETTEKIVEFVDNTRVGVLGFVGFALLFYTVVSLIQKIERAFNHVWHVTEGRSFLQRFRDYLSVIVIGPVLIFSSLGIMASLMAAPVVEQLAAIQPLGWIIEALGRLIPTVMVVAAFTFMYIFVPNTDVRVRSALIGGVVAGILWNALGWLFAAFVATSTKYTAIYSGFATPIIFMIWLYLGWLVLLLGTSIAFYHQNSEYVLDRDTVAAAGNRARERIAFLVMAAIGRNYYSDAPAYSAQSLADHLRLPTRSLQLILEVLQLGGLVSATADEPPRYLPATPPETTRLARVLVLLRSDADGHRVKLSDALSDPIVDGLMEKLDGAMEGALEGLTLKDLIPGQGASGGVTTGREARAAARDVQSLREG